jgi:hypothetical protein
MGTKPVAVRLRARSTSLAAALVLALASLSRTGPAYADERGDKIIAQMDASMTMARDQSFEYDVITREKGKADRWLAMEVRIKGPKWRLVQFLGPGDIKGLKVLILDTSKIYVWLPNLRKVRRVAGHVRVQSFMGTAFNQDDMSISTWGDVYEGKFLSETNAYWMIEGARRPGHEFPYPKVELDILKSRSQPSVLRYFDAQGKLVKTELWKNITCQGEICNAAEITIIDHPRSGIATTLVRKKWEVNKGISDSQFTERALQQ